MRLNERTIASLPDVNSHFSRGATRFVFISLGSRIDIVEPKSSHLAQMRILILGHLQNAMRYEKKLECYCIFRLMGSRELLVPPVRSAAVLGLVFVVVWLYLGGTVTITHFAS